MIPITRQDERAAARRALNVRREMQMKLTRSLDEKRAVLSIAIEAEARVALLSEIENIRTLLRNPLIATPTVRQRGKIAQIVQSRRRERRTPLPLPL